ncbi:MAG: hypothetical protein HY747_11580 [Elusimicrobia bacterium]|nr:hypothetical protein [Elusimicrobiota bacterium]
MLLKLIPAFLKANRKCLFLLILCGAGLGILLLKEGRMTIVDKTLLVGIPVYWSTTLPPLQHSVYGATVMDNQFEPLVRRGGNGLIEPLGAASWEISHDHRAIRFKIDTSRRFSDGSHLTAADYKRSWEDGLRMAPKSSNKSVADALYSVKGFNAFAEKGTIEGIIVKGDDLLEIEYEKPARVAVEYLGGVRYSAYKLIAGRAIGTGPYAMEERDGILILTPNQHYKGVETRFKEVKIIVTPPKTAGEKLLSGEIDTLISAETANLPECAEGQTGKIQCAFGQEATHVIVEINGLPGRLFSDRNHRLALQALIYKNLRDSYLQKELKARRLILDSQSFLTFQPGRLSDTEVEKLILQGNGHIPGLIEASRRKPIYLAFVRDCQWFVSLLNSAGITLTKNSGKVEFSRYLEMIYKTHEPDLLFGGFSVYNGDPDGLYHILGKNGAIFSPMMDRDGIGNLLDAGREILDRSQLAPHYQKVARAILQEVPYVHLGYDYKTVAYNSDKVRIAESFINRNNHRITIFEPK